MSTNEKFQKAVSILADGIVTPLASLARLQAERDRYPDMPMTPREEAAYKEDRDAILAQVRSADALASNALRDYQREALAEARALRAAAEADRNPQARMADELERQRLATSKTSADDFLGQARAMLAAGQPQRAALLLAVAEDKGAKFGSELLLAVADALDASDPKRSEAKAIEDAVASNSVEFGLARTRMLAKYGVGLGADGMAGTGAPGQKAAASLQAKLAAWQQAQATGKDYVEPEGVLPGAVTSSPSGT
jgi:hypothetical protein